MYKLFKLKYLLFARAPYDCLYVALWEKATRQQEGPKKKENMCYKISLNAEYLYIQVSSVCFSVILGYI